jgi:proteic killer suppression protein
MAVASFKHKALKRFYETGSKRGLDADITDKLTNMLAALDAAHDVEDAGLWPGWKLHQLTGDLDGLWSMTVTGNRRLIFSFEDGEARDIDLVDYH